MNFQIFGTETPAENQVATMLGFVVNYAKTKAGSPATLMETLQPAAAHDAVRVGRQLRGQ